MKNNLGNQTERAKQALINYIRDRKLKAGDFLPVQNDLRAMFGVGAVTIQRAVAALKDAGMLTSIPRKGVMIKNPEPNGFTGREIGLVSMYRSYDPFSMCVMQCLQLQLHFAACQSKLFVRNFPEMTHVDTLSYFDGLKRCVEQKQLHGLITAVSFDEKTWEFFHKHDLPVVSLASASRNGGYRIIHGTDVKRMFQLVRECGLLRPAMIHCGYPAVEQIRNEFTAGCSMPLEDYLFFLAPEMVPENRPQDWHNGMCDVMDRIAAMPPERRPDVVLIPDDFLVAEFHRKLVLARLKGFDWKPHLIYCRHPQLPLFSPEDIPGDYFERDLMQYAEVTVQTLLKLIRGERVPQELVLVPTEYHPFRRRK